MRTLLLIAFAVSPVFAEDTRIPASKFSAKGHTTDTLKDVKKRVAGKKAILLDVREQNEWDAGHLKYAKLVPLSVVKSGKLTTAQKKHLSKDKPIYVHCAAGGRVLQVSKLLRKQGYDIRPLQNGYADLLKMGFEKAKPKVSDKPPVPVQ